MNIRSKQFFAGVLGTTLGVMLGKLLYDLIILAYVISGGGRL